MMTSSKDSIGANGTLLLLKEIGSYTMYISSDVWNEIIWWNVMHIGI
jgi:hypothetical protein